TRRVTAADIAAIKANSGSSVFSLELARLDIDRSGTINAVDISQAKGRSGRAL
ncbi:MAG: hypothetical protein JNK75_09630, partial [Betaproteobacteria bacterium]|nr:hypothetical protein [Betaproteobacteria bacterium]